MASGISATDNGAPREAGYIDPENPPALALLVAVEDSPWTPELPPEHPHHRLFLWALEHQDQWGYREHAGFFAAVLGGDQSLWPRTRGNRRHVGLLARWVDRWQQLGYSDAAIENALDYSPGSLKRMGVLSEAATYRRWMASKQQTEWPGAVSLREQLAVAGISEGRSDDVELLIRRQFRRAHRRPRVVVADEAVFEECWEPLSYEALSETDQRRRDATLELVQRAEALLSDQRAQGVLP
jgi:hypothetical protein